MSRAWQLPLAALVLATACATASCRAVPPEARLALSPPAVGKTRVVVVVSPARRLLATARAWQVSDIHTYEVSLAPTRPLEPASEATATALPDLPATRTVNLVQRPGQVSEAVFDDLPEGFRYEASVRALGNAGGSAPDRWLNQRTPAVGQLDLSEPGSSRRLNLTVQLDPTVFSATLQLPSRLPAWATRMEATLHDAGASGDPVASASWLPGQQARLINVRGDHGYDLAVNFHSAAGHRTVRIPGLRIPRLSGQEEILAPEVAEPPPPTGTLLAQASFPADGAFMGAFDAAGRFWMTHQTSNRISVRNSALQPLLPEVSVGTEPRGIAVDRESGEAWVANFRGHSVTRINAAGAVVGTVPVGWYPSGIGVDAQHRVWVASLAFGTVMVLNPDGTEADGSPFFSGSQPTALAVDQASGTVWVSNRGDRTITKFSPAGTVDGTYGAGFEPGGLAVAADHSVWAVDAANNRVWHFGADGAVMHDPIAVGAGPAGIALNPATGEVWVGIMNGAQVTRLGPDGAVRGTYAAGAFPGTLAIEPDGHVWVVGGSALARLAP